MDVPLSIPRIDKKYSIGIPEMDAQHVRWIQLIEEFRSVADGGLEEQAHIDAAACALEQLLQYTISHFKSEEQLLAAQNYPHLEDHKKQHRELAAIVTRLLEEARAQSSRKTPLKLNFLATIWLLEHITHEDVKYARFILGKQAPSARSG